MTTLRIEKVINQLPATLSPDTLYFVKLANNTVETHITDGSGNVAYLAGSGDASGGMDSFLLMGGSTNG